MFISDLDAGAERTISKFAVNAKPEGAVDSLEGQETLKKNLHRALGNHPWHEISQEQMPDPAPGME